MWCSIRASTNLCRDLDLRFADPAPSLLACERLEVQGDVRFGHDVVCRGTVVVTNEDEQPRLIGDGTILDGRGEVLNAL